MILSGRGITEESSFIPCENINILNNDIKSLVVTLEGKLQGLSGRVGGVMGGRCAGEVVVWMPSTHQSVNLCLNPSTLTPKPSLPSSCCVCPVYPDTSGCTWSSSPPSTTQQQHLPPSCDYLTGCELPQHWCIVTSTPQYPETGVLTPGFLHNHNTRGHWNVVT